MKKLKHINLIKSIASSVCLLGASAGIIFGVSAGKFKVDYINLEDPMTRLNAALNYNYYNQDIKSEWNMDNGEGTQAPVPTTKKIDVNVWNKLHRSAEIFNKNAGTADDPLKSDEEKGVDIGTDAKEARKQFVGMILDGAAHAALDRSFNESLFHGFLDFVQNDTSIIKSQDQINVMKPALDTNVEFQKVYTTMARDNHTKIIGLAGFVHVTPLETLGAFNEGTGLFEFNDPSFYKECLLLIDGSIANNQNIASVLFRSDQSGFLTALSTAMYFCLNAHTYHENYETFSVGVYGGTPIPTVTIYMGGFQRGIEFFNHFVLRGMLKQLREYGEKGGGEWKDLDIEVANLAGASKYYDELMDWKNLEEERKNELINPQDYTGLLYDEYKVQIVKLGDFGTNFTGSFAPGDAIGITKQMLNRGVSAILPVAGSQTTDTVQEVYNQNTKTIVIGVDAPMEDGDNQRDLRQRKYRDISKGTDGSEPEYADKIIKFSAVKDMAAVTEKISRLCANNLNWDVSDPKDETRPDPDSAICNVGFKTCGNIENGLISVSWAGWSYLIRAFKHIQMFHTEEQSFEDIWKNAVNKYFVKQKWAHEEEGKVKITDKLDFYRNVTSFNPNSQDIQQYGDTGLITFYRNKHYGPEVGQPTEMYNNYSHVISILGMVLSDPETATMDFPEEITLAFPEEGQPWTPKLATEPQHGTILEWLKYNMYYMS